MVRKSYQQEDDLIKTNEHSSEHLRKQLLDDVYAKAFSGGIPAILLEDKEIQNADNSELGITKRHGLK